MLKTVLFTSDRKIQGKGPGGRPNAYPAGATYREVGLTCPESCAFFPGKRELGLNPCYATRGNVALHSRNSPYHPEDPAALRTFISNLPRRHLLRHHVSGDVGGPDGKPDAEYIEAMVEGHRENPKLRGWGYTHFWAQLKADYFKIPGLVMNASADTYEQAAQAKAAGWPVVVVLPKGENRRRFETLGLDIVTCPAQTTVLANGTVIGCASCGLCLKGERDVVVGFRQH